MEEVFSAVCLKTDGHMQPAPADGPFTQTQAGCNIKGPV